MNNNRWYVWIMSGAPGCATFVDCPKVAHATIEAAKNEAERLARQNPGKRFAVVELCGTVEVNNLIGTGCFTEPF